MAEQIDHGHDDGWILGRTSGGAEKGAFFGVTTVTVRQAVVTTVDSTTITTVDTTTITTVDTTVATTNLTAEDTLDDILEAGFIAINRLIVDSQLQAETINKLVADSRAQAKAIDQIITKTRALGLFKTS